MLTVACMKWGDKYGPEYVNVLRAMVRRNLPDDHRFVCVTDNSKGVDPGIEVIPIPSTLDGLGGPERGWKKLLLFDSEHINLDGKVLYIDLDVVILNSLMPFFEHPGDFCIIRDWSLDGIIGNSSVFRFEAGTIDFVLADFIAESQKWREKFRNEQAYLTHAVLNKKRVEYWPQDWCCSFRRHCTPAFPKRLFVEPKAPPGAKIVIFHGDPKPHEAAEGKRAKGRMPYKPAKWILDHWRLD